MGNEIKRPLEEKRVCVVVPVYDTEKQLGYCLNSLLSQSYTNWTAILVNDGSRDGSLEICRNYERLDPRFKVIDRDHGGVSSARNAGLEAAQGDYLAFLDSDDCLEKEALAKQVSLAEEHDSELVVMDCLMLDFRQPEKGRTLLSSSWLGSSPFVLDREAFGEKLMRLFLNTSLMEGPCGKLYDLRLWKELDLRFPEELSLGEDMIANLRYYKACHRVVFLDECGYYYDRRPGSGSLTCMERPDLFKIKMYLAGRLEASLGGRESLSPPELYAFCYYTAASGLSCMVKTLLSSGLGPVEKARQLREMWSDPLFSQSYKGSGGIRTWLRAALSRLLKKAGKTERPIRQNDRGS